jgi:hypothetical protein
MHGRAIPFLWSRKTWYVKMSIRDVALIHDPSCTDSIKPSLQFSCNFDEINASEGSLCFQIFFLTFYQRRYITFPSENGYQILLS